jgi:hypothetical protein
MPQRKDLPILPSTGIGELLDRYPELEELLIGMAPAFKKLKNPILRRSVGRVASLQQAAAVGCVPIGEMVNKLRSAVGQEAFLAGDEGGADAYFTERPEWFDAKKIAASLDERSGDPDKMPIAAVLQKAQGLEPGQILELVTDFLPAPGIDIMKKKGFRVWTARKEPERICTYISRDVPRS